MQFKLCFYVYIALMTTLSVIIMTKCSLSYDVAVIQWIMSYHKNCMTTRVLTLWRVRFLIEILFILHEIKSHFKRSYDKYLWSFHRLVS